MGFLLKVLSLLLVFSPLFLGTDANIHDNLKQWKEDLLRQLPDDQKICRAKNYFVSNRDRIKMCMDFGNSELCIQFCDIPVIQLNNTSISVDEGENQEDIVKYNKFGQRQAEWTWLREIGEVTLFKDQDVEIILINYDNATFAYTRTLKTNDYNTCSITALTDQTTFPVPECQHIDGQTISIKPDSDPANPIWYKFARLAFQDQRIAQLNTDKRKPCITKFLILPLVRENIMSDEELYEYNIQPNLPSGLQLNCSNILDSISALKAPRRAFVGFPGSGNSWIRLLIGIATGINTCADRVKLHEDDGCLLTLTHHLHMMHNKRSRFLNMLHFNGKGILLIRNPFKAILSAFRHIHFGAHSDSEIKTRINILGALQCKQDENKMINVKGFEKFALSHIKLWREIIVHWIKLGEVLVIHFEDVVDDKVYEVERVLRFLHTALDKRRMECMKYASLDFYRRRSKIMTQTLYSEQLSSIFMKNIDIVNDLLVQFGHRGIPYAKYKL